MAKKEPKVGPVVVRMLLDQQIGGVSYRGDDLVQVDGTIAAALVEAFSADDSPEAVAYVQSLGGQVKVHEG